jgi:hypothetical protein
VSKAAYITEMGYTFEMTDTSGDGICCQYGASEFKINVNGKPRAMNNSGEFRDVIR